MTYIEILRIADQKLNNNEITLGEYEEMIKPLGREVIDKSVLEDIKAEIETEKESMIQHNGTTDLGLALEIIDKHIGKETK